MDLRVIKVACPALPSCLSRKKRKTPSPLFWRNSIRRPRASNRVAVTFYPDYHLTLMDCRALSPSSLPHTSKLIHDYVENFSRLQNFYQHKPELHSAEAYARQLNFPADRRREVAAILRADNLSFGSGPETESNLRRLGNGAVAVVSGQQVGFSRAGVCFLQGAHCHRVRSGTLAFRH